MIEYAIQSAIEKALELLQGTINSLTKSYLTNRQMQELQNLVSDIQDDMISTSMRLEDLEKKNIRFAI
ncbi:hypothetical protein XELAEV_18003773mg [Xenopus laevis]|nr:hypothetical protein XELAEV_18003773mg [Xenopus laevis]